MTAERADKNPPKKYVVPRVNIPSNLPTPAPTTSLIQRPKWPTPIVNFEEYEYRPHRVETNSVHGGAPSYNTRHRKCLKYLTHVIGKSKRTGCQLSPVTSILEGTFHVTS